MPHALPLEDARRLRAVRALRRGADPVLEGLVRSAIDAAGANSAAVSLVDETVSYPQAPVGPLWSALSEAGGVASELEARKDCFCARVTTTGRPLIVTDTLAEPSYAGHPMVYGPPHIRRYIGAPIPFDGYFVGALCVFDSEASRFQPGASERLSLLAEAVGRRYAAGRDATMDHNLVDCIPDGWGVVGSDLVVRDVNTATCRLLGMAREKIVGRPAIDFVAPEVREFWRAAAAAAFGGSRMLVRDVRTILVRRSGERAPVRIWFKIWGEADAPVIGGVIRAVAPHRSHELSLRQRECLRWAGAGKTDMEIALLMGIAPSTVHNHIEAAKRKLGVATRIQAILTVFNVHDADLIRSFARRAN